MILVVFVAVFLVTTVPSAGSRGGGTLGVLARCAALCRRSLSWSCSSPPWRLASSTSHPRFRSGSSAWASSPSSQEETTMLQVRSKSAERQSTPDGYHQ